MVCLGHVTGASNCRFFGYFSIARCAELRSAKPNHVNHSKKKNTRKKSYRSHVERWIPRNQLYRGKEWESRKLPRHQCERYSLYQSQLDITVQNSKPPSTIKHHHHLPNWKSFKSHFMLAHTRNGGQCCLLVRQIKSVTIHSICKWQILLDEWAHLANHSQVFAQ